MRLGRVGVVTVAAFAALGAGVAVAEETITASPNNRYDTTSVTIDQGEKLIFTNNDVAMHDVTAKDSGPDRKPLFQSELIGNGKSSEVKGADSLTTGSYGFFCSVHPNMTGTLTVGTAGTPVPRPGATPTPAPTDPATPRVTLKLSAPRASSLRARRRLNLRLTLSKAARVTISAWVGGKRIARMTDDFDGSGAGELTLRIGASKAVRAKLRKGAKLLLKASAVDAELRRGTARTTVRLR